MHANHLFLLAFDLPIGRGSGRGRTMPAARRGGSLFDRRTGVSIQAVPTLVSRLPSAASIGKVALDGSNEGYATSAGTFASVGGSYDLSI